MENKRQVLVDALTSIMDDRGVPETFVIDVSDGSGGFGDGVLFSVENKRQVSVIWGAGTYSSGDEYEIALLDGCAFARNRRGEQAVYGYVNLKALRRVAKAWLLHGATPVSRKAW